MTSTTPARRRGGIVAGLVRQESDVCQERHSAGQDHLRDRQLWLRLGAEAEKRQPASGVHDSPSSAQEAWLTARDSDVDVNFDDDAMNPHFSYLDEHGLQHDIWFLDAVTALNQMRAAQTLGSRHLLCGD